MLERDSLQLADSLYYHIILTMPSTMNSFVCLDLSVLICFAVLNGALNNIVSVS